MAKKKQIKKKPTRSRKKKKKSGSSSFFSSIKRILFWILLITIGFIALMFLFDRLYPQKEKLPLNTEKKKAPSSQSTTHPEKNYTYTLSFPKDVEIPRLQNRKKEQVVYHEGYTVSYNSDYRIANWVAWELTAQEARSGDAKRSNKFVSDPKVKGPVAHTNDYTRTGYDRGHLAPAGDMKWSDNAMKESFYLSNICPQDPSLNRGVWKDLEEQSRLWALDYGAIHIVCGPVITDKMKRVGKNNVGVPELFYKVICTISDNKYQGIAFLLENKGYNDIPLRTLAIPIDSVESVTGIDFFYLLPDGPEEEMESTVDLSKWSF